MQKNAFLPPSSDGTTGFVCLSCKHRFIAKRRINLLFILLSWKPNPRCPACGSRLTVYDTIDWIISIID